MLETSQKQHGKSIVTFSGIISVSSQGQNQSGRQTALRPGPVHRQKQETRPESNSSSFETLVVPAAASINAEEGEVEVCSTLT